MTPTLSPSPVGAARPGRVQVDDISVVVVARPGRPLEDVLDALERQSRLPQRVLVVGPDPDGEEIAAARAHPLVSGHRVPLIARQAVAGAVEAADGRAGEAPGVEAAGNQADGDQLDGEQPDRDQLGSEQLGGDQPGLGTMVEWARQALPVHAEHWLWVLHDDTLPESGALEALVAAVRRSSRVGIVGPKLVRLDDPRLLVGVGHHVTSGGRAADTRHAALVDQGQLDLRQDVIGVPLAGSLIRSDAIAEAGGIDPSFADDGVEGLDLGWRSHLVGHRVVVAPDAVVRQGDAGLGVVDGRRTRARQRQLALARGPAWAAPFRALTIAVTSSLAALVLLLVKRPSEAADEWADVGAILRPARGRQARSRFRSRRTVRHRDLRGLFMPGSTGWRSTVDTVGEALDPHGRQRRDDRTQAGGGGGAETGPVSDEFAEIGVDRGRRPTWSWPLFVAVVVSALGAGWQWRRLLPGLRPDGPGVAGGELGTAATDAAGLWRSALDGWRGGGLGHDLPAEPWLLPLSAVTSGVDALSGAGLAPATAGVALGWMLLLAQPASVLTAYLGQRRATHRRWLRAGLAVGWAGLAPLTVAVGQGRVGPAVVHVLAPLLLAGYAVCASRSGGTRRAAAAFGTVLGVALAAQWVPLVLVAATLGGVALGVLGRGSARWRGVAIAVLPWLLLLPWLPALVTEPERLLGGAGATIASATFPPGAEGWQLLLLHPGGPVDPASLSAVPLWLTVPLWLAALGALLLRGNEGRRAALLVCTAIVLAALAVAAPRFSLGVLGAGHQEAGLVVTTWSGTLLSLAGAGLLLAAAAGLDRLLDLVDGARRTVSDDVGEAPDPKTRPHDGDELERARPVLALTATATALVVLAGVLSLGWTAMTGQHLQLREATDPLPAVAAEQARGPAAQRTLVLSPMGGPTAPSDAGVPDGAGDDLVADPLASATSIDVDLLGVEPEPARVLRDRARELTAGVPQPGEVEEAVVMITGGGSPDDAVSSLDSLGVGYVLLEADDTHPLVAQVDRLPGLTRVSTPEGRVLWRMTDNDAARVRLVAMDGEQLGRLDVTGPHGASAGVLEDVPEGAFLEVAEGQGWHTQATVLVDGSPRAVGPDGRIELPTGTHEVEIDVRTPMLVWYVVALLLAVVVAFLALPVGRADPDTEEQVR